MKILAIGNSFSSDATRYLYGIARAAGKKVKVANLYIGGCSLYRHYRNMLSGEDAYSFELNGASSGLFVSLKKALLSDEWDVVTVQQCSPQSFREESYEPYLTRLVEYVREHAPKAKVYVHQTWAYEAGCQKLVAAGAESAEAMYRGLTEQYDAAAERIGAAGIIPCGDAMWQMQAILAEEGRTVYRDTFHADLGLGRYLLGLVWCRVLCGCDVTENAFRDFDKEVSEEDVRLAQRIATEAVDARAAD